ncbi:MAG: FAD-binding oxidoreductase [Proteobacteria bacterium]|nr:FAD-binding oxidoreductase [Pseudomonadota bacterium]
MDEPDIVVIGGGIVGSAIAWGAARSEARVCVLDEGDIALRASRGNFALIWVQTKGLGMSDYSAWTKLSADRWPSVARDLQDETGVDVALRQPGGFMLSLSDEEMQRRIERMHRLRQQPRMVDFPVEVLVRSETKRRLPLIGPDVVGALYSPLDCHVNSLRLFRALHAALKARGVEYRPNQPVTSVKREPGGFVIQGDWGTIGAGKVVLAAGLGNARLAPMVGLAAPVTPSKGQIIATERTTPFLHYPLSALRQTDEGSVLIGDSQEDLGFDTAVTNPILSVMASRAVRMFPLISRLNVVRTWSALRVMSPDGFPIYDHSVACPGAFLATCHSGITLAASHATELAPAIAQGGLPAECRAFGAHRFNGPN